MREGDDHGQNREEVERENEQHPDTGQDDAAQRPDTGQDDAAQRPDTGQDDAAQRPDTEQDEIDEDFSPSLVREDIGPTVELEQSFLENARANLEAIDQEYNEISEICEDIGNLQGGFRQRLRVQEEILLSECFKHLRQRVGKYSQTLNFNTERMCIEIGEEEDEDAQEAVEKYNCMLERCKEFQEKKPKAERVIKEKMTALAGESIQTQATQEAVQYAQQKYDALLARDNDIQRILTDTKSAAKYLLPPITTGVITMLRE